MRIDSPLMTNAIATGSFSGSFVGAFEGDITADSVAYDNITGKPTLVSGSAQVVALVEAGTDSNTFTDADHTKLNGIEASATADQTDAEIRTAVENASDSNVFTDADHTKLNGIEASADVTDATNVTAAGALMDSELAEIATVKALTAAGISGSLSAAALVALGANLVSGSASDVRTFLNVEDGATGDQSNAEIRTAVEAATDSNVFTDADHTKLNGIEASADVTDTSNVTSAGALMDSEVTALALIKGLTAAQISGSGNVRFEALNAATSSYALKSGASLISASVLSSPSQGTIRLATNGVNTDVDSGLQSGDSPTFSGLTISNNVTVNGNLSVLGDATELQVSNLRIEDKLIEVASGSADSAAADGAGLSIDGADKALTWNHANTRFNFDAALNVAGNITTSGTVDGRDVATDGSKLDGIEANATADQTKADINALDITEVGTIDSGVWNGTAIASAYLDADTAHLSGTQTFSGAKTFSAAVTVSNNTASTSKTTGAVKVTGGVGIQGALNVGGDVVAFASSDERLKDNINEIPNCLGRLKDIKGVEFDWNDKQSVFQGHDIGVIAQDIEKVAPSLVTDRDNGYKAVKYEKLTAILIQAVKELHAKVEELENK